MAIGAGYPQEVFLWGEMGQVTGQAGQGFAGPLDGGMAGRVAGERMVATFIAMATQAEGLDIASGEGLGIPAMGGMASRAEALHHWLVARVSFLCLAPQLLVALQAKVLRIAGQQRRRGGGMGHMADHALARHDRRMREGHFRGGGNLVVAHEAEVGGRRIQSQRLVGFGIGMAGIAGAFRHRRVPLAAQHPFGVGTVWIMAGETEFRRDGIALVFGHQVRHLVAGDTEFPGWADQPLGLGATVGQMATQALAGCHGRVGMLGLGGLCDGRVAGDAQLLRLAAQQMLIGGTVGCVALAAGVVLVGLMDPGVLLRIGGRVAGDAYPTLGQLQQGFLARGMGLMAGEALAVLEGRMLRASFGSLDLVVTVQAQPGHRFAEIKPSLLVRRRVAVVATLQERRVNRGEQKAFLRGGVGIVASRAVHAFKRGSFVLGGEILAADFVAGGAGFEDGGGSEQGGTHLGVGAMAGGAGSFLHG